MYWESLDKREVLIDLEIERLRSLEILTKQELQGLNSSLQCYDRREKETKFRQKLSMRR